MSTPKTLDDYSDIEVSPQTANALMYHFGLQQWLSPNADIEYAQEALSVADGIVSFAENYSEVFDEEPMRESGLDRATFIVEQQTEHLSDDPDLLVEAVECDGDHSNDYHDLVEEAVYELYGSDN